MRLSLFIFVFLVTFITALAQKSPATEPFIIQGQLTNFTKGEMIFFFRDPQKGLKDHTIDTVKVDSTGRFYLKTYAITKPTVATLRKEELSVNVYAAPGYNLTLTGDVKDMRQFMLQKKITGIGAQSNRYLFAQDVANYAYRDSVSWYEMKEKDLLKFIKKDKRIRDSLYVQAFGNNKLNDKWLAEFAKLTRLDNAFLHTYYLLNLVTYDSTFDYARSVSFLAANTDQKLWANLYNEENLVSENYISWFMGTYPEYIRRQEIRKSPSYAQDKDDIELVREMAANYKGQIREIKMFTKMKGLITYCRSFEELEGYKSRMPKYIALLKSGADQKELTQSLVDKETELMRARIGKPAPLFEAADSTGVVYKLSDYNGKVVYLDLWASWCGPCRAEAPHLKKLTEKYQNQHDVVFISVAVMDKPDKWRGALKQDNPSGLQLYDTNGTVQNGYFANSIPKFILINKKGEIVSFDAPAPSRAAALEAMLDKEIKN
jgi:thiol-disulfide isomerase/thioredoxin